MGTGKIQFSSGESPALDELRGGTPAQVNVMVDAAGALRMRPGITALDSFPSASNPNASPVTQIGEWKGSIVFTSLDRKLWSFTPGIVSALSDTTAATKLDGGLRPVMAATRTRMIITGGGVPQKWEGGALTARLGGSPPSASHVATIAQRVVLNDSGVSGILYWSGIGDTGAETWLTGLNYREAETKQDRCTGLYTNSNELVALGTETVQMLSPDPSEVFTNARTIDVGWGPPHSYIALDEMFMGLDARDRAVMSNGRSQTVISSPAIGQQLKDIADVSDCFGFRYQFGNYDLGVLNFPSDGRAFVYDAGAKLWSEWRGWNASHSAYGGFAITAHFHWADEGLDLVGLSNGGLAVLDSDATDDLGDPIVVQATSTFTDQGTSKKKHSKRVRLTFKRGTATAASPGTLLYSYRDDLGPFGEPIRLDIGDATDVEPVVTVSSLGTYRTRQHRIIVDSVAFRFASMEEDFEILDN